MTRERTYRSLVDRDWLEKVDPLLHKGFFLNEEGRLELRQSWLLTETDWIFTVPPTEIKCNLWHYVYFELLGLLPRNCLDCYKVVVRPRTLKELYRMHDLQLQLDRPAKCGIETRTIVCALYGAYFYNLGLEQGRERYREVRDAVSEKVAPDVPVILKRGCSEFELRFGRSDRWDNLITRRQIEFEELLEEKVIFPAFPLEQREEIKIHTYRKWIEWAWQHGDLTCLEYTEGRPLYPPPATYED